MKKAVERKGWISVQRHDEAVFNADILPNVVIPQDKRITKKQKDTVMEWCQAHNVKIPSKLKEE